MNVESVNLEAVRISNVPRVDDIVVLLQDIEPGQGKAIIESGSEAWAGYFPDMGELPVKRFFIESDSEYLVQRLWCHARLDARREAYLLRLVEAAKDGLLKSSGSSDAIFPKPPTSQLHAH